MQRGQVAYSDVRAAWGKWKENPSGFLTHLPPPTPSALSLSFLQLVSCKFTFYQLGMLNQGASVCLLRLWWRHPGLGAIHQSGKPFSECLAGIWWNSLEQNRPEPCPPGKHSLGRYPWAAGSETNRKRGECCKGSPVRLPRSGRHS